MECVYGLVDARRSSHNMVIMLLIRSIVLIQLLFLLNGCVRFSKAQNETKLDLEADAVKVLFDHFYGNRKAVNAVLFISYGWSKWDGNISPMPYHFAPAPKNWLKKMALPGVEVKNVTESVGKDNGFIVVDKAGGKKGSIFQVENILWVSPTEIHVNVWFYHGFMCASGETMILVLENGKTWHIVRSEDYWMQ